MSHYNDDYSAEELSNEDKEYLVQKLGAKAAQILANEVDEEEAEEFRLSEQATKESAVFDLDAALDSYDPTFPRYTPSADAFEFFTLMRLVEGKDFDFSTPIAHYFMVDMLLGYITDPMMFPYSEEVCRTIEIDNLAIGFMESRGLAKSTVVISFFGVYSAIKGELPNGIGKVYFYLWLAASSKGGARINALAVRAMCEDSVYLKNYFESMRFTETESEFTRKGAGPTKNRSFLVRYQGINTGVRGSRYGERRPDLIGTDDAILNTAAAYSKVMTANLEDIIYSDALAALKGGGKGRLINTFTPFHYNDVNTKAILNGTFTPVIIPIAADFDIDKADLTARDIESSWEDMHPATSIAKMVRKAKASNKLKSFLQERMLRLASDADRLIPEKCIQFCDTTIIQDNLYAYNIYITTDFTTTSGETSDFSAAAVWAIGNNGDWFLLDLVLRKMDMDEQYRTVLDWAARYKRMGKHVEIGVEVDGSQTAHIFSLEKIMMERSDWYTFARQKGVDKDETRKGILSRKAGGSKHERFRVAVTQFMLPQKLWLPEHLKDTKDMKEFLDQIRGATHANFARSDDACFTGDTLVHMADGGLKRIDQVQKGDMVITSAIDSAYSKCGAAIMTGVNEVNTYHMSDGSEISMTKNHPVYTTDGWILAEDLLPEHKIVKGTKCNQQSQSSDTNGQEKIQDTTNLLQKLMVNVGGSINGLGKELMVNSQKGMTFTTKITTPIIMPSKIWNYLVQQSMQSITKTNVGYYVQKKIERRIGYNWMLLEYLLMSGIVQTKDDNGIENTERELKMLYLLKINNAPAIHAVRKLCHTLKRETCTAQISAPSKQVLKEIRQSIRTFVWYVEKSMDLTEIKAHLKRVAKNAEKSYQDKTHLKNVLKNVKVAESCLQTVKVRGTALSAMQEKTKHLQVYPALSVEQYLTQVAAQLNTAQYNVELITLTEKGETREEKTYNLEVEDTSTYLVSSGVVVHNCDLVSMLNHMVVVQPTQSVTPNKSTNIKRGIYSSMDFDVVEESYRGSTVF